MIASDKPTIFILHGWSTGLNKNWPIFIKELKRQGLKAKLLKIPGLTATLNQVWDLNDYADWLYQKILSEGQIILIGHSFGGQIAVRFAAKHPEVLNRLILIDSAGVRDHSLPMEIKRKLFSIIAKVGKGLWPSDLARKLLYALIRERDYLNASPRLRETMRAVINDEVGKDLVKIKLPTLIIWGSLDRITPIRLSQIFSQKLSNSKLVVIDQARHAPHFSHPQEVSQVIKQFLS